MSFFLLLYPQLTYNLNRTFQKVALLFSSAGTNLLGGHLRMSCYQSVTKYGLYIRVKIHFATFPAALSRINPHPPTRASQERPEHG